MSSSFCNLIYHMVFSTKDRRTWLTDGIRPRVHDYLGGAIRGENGIPFLVGGIADHVHILAKLRQDKAVSDVLRDIKANSSGWVHRELSLPEFGWQSGFAAFTVSPSQVPRAHRYITGQEEHHKRMSFQEEFIALLKAHVIEYDEQYIWR